MITAVVLTKNEEECIEKCLRSLVWCDEIVVIDDFSTDGTLRIINGIREIKGKVKVIQNHSQGNMAEIRNLALDKAFGNWVFFVDADEVVPSELAREAERLTDRQEKYSGFMVSRKDFFLGKFLRFGETGKIKLLRLGKRDTGKWVRGVHETWKITGATSELTNSLEHYSHRSIRQFIFSINRWTDFDADELSKEGKKFAYYRLIINPAGKFLQNYFLRFGLLDGFPGFVMAYMMSLQSLIVRVKQYDPSTASQGKT